MKVFLDASVMYSASRQGSLMERFIGCLLGSAKCCTNDYAFEEARRNLEANEPEQIERLTALGRRLEFVPTLAAVTAVPLREKDRPILGGAVAGVCSHLVTSDRRDFGVFFGTVIEGVKIVSPQLMAEELGLQPAEGRPGQSPKGRS